MRSLTLFLVFAVLCPAAQAVERPIPPRPGTYQFFGEGQYWKNTRNYSNSGSSTALPNGTEYQNIMGNLGASYDFSRYVRTMLSLSFAQASSVNLDQVNALNPNISRSNAGLNEANATAMGWFNFGSMSLAPVFSFTYPFFRIDEESNNVLLGEGALRARLGTWGVWRLGQFQPFLFLGYEYRDGGRSSLMPYNAGVHFRFLSRFWVQAEYRGQLTASEDGDTNERGVRDLYTTRVNGSSFRYYGVNPEFGEAAIEGGIRFKGFGIYGGFATTIHGSDYADGNLIYAGVSYSGRIKLAPARPAAEQEENFEIEQDQYDETLFQEEGGKKIKRKVRKQPSVDKLLHETEKELQQE